MLSYSDHQKLINLSEQQYINIVNTIYFDELSEGIVDSLTGYFKRLFKEFSKVFQEMVDEIGMDVQMIEKSFQEGLKDPTFFKILKSFAFSIKKITHAVLEVTKAFASGLLVIFEEIHKSKIIQKVQKGLMNVDEFIDKYPILKQIRGKTLAGLLILGWLNMTFIGDTRYDFDWSKIWDTFKHSGSLADCLVSANGLLFLTLLSTGVFLGLGVAWFGVGANVAFAIFYTLIKKNSKFSITKKILKLKKKFLKSYKGKKSI